ncbi:MAG TPA: NAD(P)H-dependent oxidoreductase subunit E [Candidatus Polarisedimenticolia bacterium]|nr:NAD(P)H-dependent oxidoreductase subunit E [Candidatus Polarisedimenticolia bacterium]
MSLPVRDETDRRIESLKALFPQQGSALLPALHLIQEDKGYVSEESMVYVAGKLGLSPAFVAGVVSFYTMFHTRPVGRHHLQICRTLPCALRGCVSLLRHAERRLGIRDGQTTADGRFSLTTVECLGNCDKAPALQINDKDYGPLDERAFDALVETLK